MTAVSGQFLPTVILSLGKVLQFPLMESWVGYRSVCCASKKNILAIESNPNSLATKSIPQSLQWL